MSSLTTMSESRGPWPILPSCQINNPKRIEHELHRRHPPWHHLGNERGTRPHAAQIVATKCYVGERVRQRSAMLGAFHGVSLKPVEYAAITPLRANSARSRLIGKNLPMEVGVDDCSCGDALAMNELGNDRPGGTVCSAMAAESFDGARATIRSGTAPTPATVTNRRALLP